MKSLVEQLKERRAQRQQQEPDWAQVLTNLDNAIERCSRIKEKVQVVLDDMRAEAE